MENDDAHLGRKSIAEHSKRSQNDEAQPSTSLFTDEKNKNTGPDSRCYSIRIQNQILAKAQQNKNTTSSTYKDSREATHNKAAKRGRKAQHPLNRRDNLSLWRLPGRSNVFTVIGKPNNGFFPLSYSTVAAGGASNNMQTAPYPSVLQQPQRMLNQRDKTKTGTKANPRNPQEEPPASTTTDEVSTTGEVVPSIKKIKKENEWKKVTKKKKKPKNIKTEDTAKTYPRTKDNTGTKVINKKKKPKIIKTEDTPIMYPVPKSEILCKEASSEIDTNMCRGRKSIEEYSKKSQNNKAQPSTSLFTDDKNKNTGQDTRCYSLRIQNQIWAKAQKIKNTRTSNVNKASPGNPQGEPPAPTSTGEVISSVKNIKKEDGWTKVTKKKKQPKIIKTEEKPIIIAYPEPRIIVKEPPPVVPEVGPNISRINKDDEWTKVTKKKKNPKNIKTEDKPIILAYPEPRIIVKEPSPVDPEVGPNISRKKINPKNGRQGRKTEITEITMEHTEDSVIKLEPNDEHGKPKVNADSYLDVDHIRE